MKERRRTGSKDKAVCFNPVLMDKLMKNSVEVTKMKQISDEEFLKLKGWRKVQGWKINLEELSNYDNYDYLYVEDLEEWVEKCDFWQNDDFDEQGYGETEDIIERFYEEYMDNNGNLYDEPVQEKEVGKWINTKRKN